jgi:hypothetical protein
MKKTFRLLIPECFLENDCSFRIYLLSERFSALRFQGFSVKIGIFPKRLIGV